MDLSSRRAGRSPSLQQRNSLRVDTSAAPDKTSHLLSPRLTGNSDRSHSASRTSPEPTPLPTFQEEYTVGSPTSIDAEAGPSRLYLEKTVHGSGSSTAGGTAAQAGAASAGRYGASRNSNQPGFSLASPTDTPPKKSWRRWSKDSSPRDYEAASSSASSAAWHQMFAWPSTVNLNALMRSKLARTALSVCLLIFLVVSLLRKESTPNANDTASTNLISPKDLWSGGAGTQRDIHQNMANPESIPHHELTNLTSTLDPSDTTIDISVLLIPSPHSTAADALAHVQQLSSQTRRPVSFHLPDESAHLLQDLNTINPDLKFRSFSDTTSHFTLALPLSSHTLSFGPSVLQNLLHLAHTREFSGALLELGCAQGLFAQSTWIDKLDLAAHSPFEGGNPSLWWRRSGLSSLRVPLEEQDAGEDAQDFYINGIGVNCAPRRPLGSAGRPKGRVLFMFEPDVSQWEDGWQELACDFMRATATLKWSSQVVIFQDAAEDLDLPDFSCGRRGQLETTTVDYADWLADTSEADAIIYVNHGFVDQSLRLVPEASRPWQAIGLPQRDLASAAFIAALDVEAIKNWHIPKIDIVVITNNRPHSLDRLLDSLKASHYFGDSVSMSVSMEQTADPTTHRMIGNVRWPHGPLHVRHRIMLGGLMPAIVESWYPPDNDTYGVFLEDDVEVSPLFYAWLKFSLLQYRYTVAGRALSQRLFGVSLYQPKSVELRPEGRRPFDAHNLFAQLSLPHNSPYLSQVPCSWGAAYFPEAWREFHQYLSLRLSEHSIDISDTIVPDVRSNRWPKSWKKYFIEMVYLRGYMMLYPNYPNFESFSTNHLEMGTHVHVAEVDMKKKVQFTVPLMPDDDPLQLLNLPGHVLPDWPFLPVLDLWGTVTTEEEAIYRGYTALKALGNCAEPGEAPAYDLTVAPTHDAQELLCPRQFEPALDLDVLDAELQEIEAAELLAAPQPEQRVVR